VIRAKLIRDLQDDARSLCASFGEGRPVLIDPTQTDGKPMTFELALDRARGCLLIRAVPCEDVASPTAVTPSEAAVANEPTDGAGDGGPSDKADTDGSADSGPADSASGSEGTSESSAS
jgi:hypothetical protein